LNVATQATQKKDRQPEGWRMAARRERQGAGVSLLRVRSGIRVECIRHDKPERSIGDRCFLGLAAGQFAH